ncbi:MULTISPECIES: acyltransferase domain-containing protein [unclassified Streptomyces]|uniref:acyltransferase domain-containing protein n=1 Tax=unclassified Streptomyces TaxID=2593676 RepID=UPI000DDB8873|nr:MULTISPECIES: acyltransferase domain-containing protein [unclassified Streptomyces]QZZ24956.1 acyltransferase domain-containing protein [Streptomyces sp. ST1015]
MSKCVVLFPGQGAYVPGALCALAEAEPVVGEVLAAVDRAAVGVGREPVSRLLLDPGAPALGELVDRAPQDLHLAIFASELALFRLLTERLGVRPDVLLGHSFGELVALVAAGAHDLEQGVALVAARDEAFAACPPRAGGMVALEVSAGRAGHLLAALAEGEVCVAADNGPRQCVVSGPQEALRRVRKAAEAVGIPATELRVPYPFHSHGLAGVAHEFAVRAGELTPRPLRHRLYSAILGRYFADDAHSTLAAGHLVRPTRFADAVRALHAEGAEVFVECGAKGVLSDLVTGIVPGVRAVAPLRRRVGAREFVAALGELVAEGAAPGGAGLWKAASAGTVPQEAAAAGPVPGAVPARPVPGAASGGAVRAKTATPGPMLGVVPGGSVPARPVSPGAASAGAAPTETAAVGPAQGGPVSDAAAPGGAVSRGAALRPRAVSAVGDSRPGSPAGPASLPGHAELVGVLRDLYSRALGYPPDVLTPGADLEADLGIDSIKQVELFSRALERYGRRLPPGGSRLTSYTTLDDLAALLRDLPTAAGR